MLIYAVNAVLVIVDSEKIFGEKSLMQFVDVHSELIILKKRIYHF